MALPFGITPEENAKMAIPFLDESEYETVRILPSGAKGLVRRVKTPEEDKAFYREMLTQAVIEMALERMKQE